MRGRLAVVGRCLLALVLGAAFVVVPTSAVPDAQAADGQNPEECLGSVALVNGGFESPLVSSTTSPNFRLFNESDVPGWDTTATDNQIEIWQNNFLGVPAHSGGQFAELNATQASTLYQTVPTAPGQILTWSLAHRGRNGTDVMAVEFGAPGAAANSSTQISDGNTAWRVSSGTYVVPAGQTTTELRFRAVSNAGNNLAVGNLIDSIVFGTSACVIVSKSVVNNTRSTGPAQVGDELTYTISSTNAGGNDATATVMTDPIPVGAAYIPGSLRVVTSPVAANVGPKTDAVDTDTASFSAGIARFGLGLGATGTAGGSLGPGETSSVSFRVSIQPAAASGSVINQAAVGYTGGNINPSVSNRVTTPVAAAADLSIAKVSDPTSQVAGNQVTYRVTATNNGPNAAAGVVLTDTLPAGTTYVSSAPPVGTTCSNAGQTVTCTTAALANGASVALPIVVRLASSLTTSVVNSVSVASSTSDFNSTNDAATATTAVTRQADLSLTKIVNPTSVNAGNTVTYTLSAANAGPSDSSAVVIADTLPAGMTVVSATPSTGTCSTTASSLSCPVGTIAPGATPSVSVVARVAPGTAASTLNNTGSVTSTTPDATPANNSATAPLTVTTSADLSITKTGPAQATAGRNVTFTVTVRNDGPSDAASVVVSDPTPAGLTLVAASTSQGTCTDSTCTIGTLAAGGIANLTYEYTVDPGRTASVTNTATVASATPDPDTADRTASATVAIVASADLSLSKTQSPATVIFGQPVTYSLAVTNNGPSTATGVVITDTLPPGLTFASSADGCTGAGSVVTCSAGTVAVGATVTRSFVANTSPLGSGTVTNSAIVSATTPDPVAGNNTSTSTANGAATADLSMTKTTNPNSPVAGETVTYTLTVVNGGPSAALGISAVDTLPSGVSFVSADPACSVSGSQVTCTAALLAPQASVAFTIEGQVAPNARGESSNSATATAQTPGDLTPGNNTGTSTVTLSAEADVFVTLGPDTQTGTAGEEVTFQLVLGNNGPSTARNVVVTGQVPPGLTPVEGSTGGACEVTGSTITCAVPLLQPGQTLPAIELRAVVDASVAAGTEITATGQARSDTPDTDPDNNQDSAIVVVETEADVSIAKRVTPNPLVAGGPADYTLTVTNDGPSNAIDLTVTDALPTGFTATSVNTGSGTCTSGATVTCTAALLAAGSSVDITIAGTLASNLTEDVSNTAQVTTGTPDPDADNNTVTIETPLIESADLRVNKTGPATIVAGQRIEYTITISNVGPSDATGVEVVDQLPPGVLALGAQAQASDGTPCGVATDGQVSCEFGDMPVGASHSVTITAPVDPSLVPGTVLSNTATAISATEGPSDGSTSPAVETVVEANADISLTKLPGTTAVAGAEMRYTLVVRNDGPSTATNVVISDPTPPNSTLTNVSVEGGATCADVDGDAQCTLASLEPGGVVTVIVRYVLDPDTYGEEFSNTASVTSDTPDLHPEDDTATATTTVTDSAVLRIEKVGPTTPVVAGNQASFTITVTNDGPSDARGVTMTDTLPAGLSVVSATPSNAGLCETEDQVLTCAWDLVPLDGIRTVALIAAVDSGVADGTTLTNSAKATAVTPGPSATDTADVAVITSADLSVAKELLTSTPTAGRAISWRLTVTNGGPSSATGVTLTDPAPAGVTLTGATTAQGTCAVVDGDLSCQLGTVAVGDPVSVVLTGTLGSHVTGDVSNTASVSAITSDPNTANNSGSVSTAIGTSADLSLTKTATADQVVAGGPIQWQITVRNRGSSDATNVIVTDALPAGVLNASATIGTEPCTVVDSQVECAQALLASGGTAQVVISGTVDPATTMTSLANDASVTSEVPDPNATNNGDSVAVDVTTSADLGVAKTGPATANAGMQVSWTVTVTNTGPSVARAVTVADVVPASVLSPSASVGGVACPVPADNTITCSLGDIAVGASVDVTVTGTIDPSATDPVVNTASATSSTADPEADNNSASVTTTLTRSADLRIRKVTEQTSAIPGEPISWLLTVTNDGPSDASAVEVADEVPTGVAGLSASIVGGGACEVTGNDVTCSIATLAATSTVQIRIAGEVAADLSGTTLANTATVTSQTDDPDATDNSATSTVPLAPSADLFIGKRIVGDAVAGAQLTFEIVVSNEGPSVARGVEVSDDLPATLLSPSVETAGCTITDGALTCTLGDLTPGADPVVIEITGTLDQAFGQTVANTATVTSQTPDANTTNDSSTASDTIDDSALVSVLKEGPAALTAGESVTWTITVTNDGPSDARDVRLADRIPAGVTDAEMQIVDGAACADLTDCRLETLASGASVEVTVTGIVAPDFGGTSITNSVSVQSETSDPNGGNNTSSARSRVVRSADLVPSKSVLPSPLVPGQAAEYTLTITNNGPSQARNATFEDTLAAGLTVAGAVEVTGGTAECTVAAQRISCVAPTLANGGVITVTVPVTLRANVTSAVSNTLTAFSDTPDPTPDDDATIVTPVAPVAELVIDKSAPATTTAGEALTWNVTVTNNGPSDAQGVTLTDALPAGMAARATFSTSQGSCEVEGADLICDLGVLGATGSVQIQIVLPVAATAAWTAATIDNAATLASPTPEPGGGEGTRTDSVSTAVERSADLRIAKTHTQSAVVPGSAGPDGLVTWEITVINDGPSTARNVIVTDTLPAALTDVEFTAPTGVTCSNATGVCTLGTLAVDAEVRFTVSGRLPAAYADATVFNAVSVASDDPDPEARGNSATDAVTVQPQADLSVSKTGPASAVPGTEISWTLTVSNAGPSTAVGAVVTDTLPEAVTDVEASGPDGWNCTMDGNALRCAADMGFAPEGRAEFTVTAAIPAEATGSIANLSTVRSDTLDPTPMNNTDSVTTNLTPQADLTITKLADDADVIAGQAVAWTIGVTNSGESVARAVTVTDDIPTVVLDPVAMVGDQECAATGTRYTCSLGDLAVGAETTVTVTGTIDPDAAEGPVTNTANVSSTTPDPDNANNIAAALVNVTRSADLAITKTADPALAVPGDPMTYTLTVTNAGPSTSQGAVVTDALPAALLEPQASTEDGACEITDSVVVCTLDTIAVGGSAIISIDGTIDPDVDPGEISNAATVVATTSDPETDNNGDSVGTAVSAGDLSLTKTADTDQAVPGAQLTWTLTVTNAGPGPARNVVLTDALPEVATGARASTDAGTCEITDGVVMCQLGRIAAEATITVTISVTVAPDALGEMENTASVTSPDDPATENNVASAVTPIEAVADLGVVKTTEMTAPIAGTEIVWTITVSNSGPAAAVDVVVTDGVPEGVTSVDVDTPTGACTITDNTQITCLLGTLAAGDTVQIEVTGTIGTDVRGDLTNSASATSATTDLSPEDNVSSVTSDVVGDATMGVSKTVSTKTVVAGNAVLYTITVKASGTSTARGVMVVENMPETARVVTSEADQGTYVTSTAAWTVGTLEPGATATLKLRVALDDPGMARNTVAVTADGAIGAVAGVNTEVRAPAPRPQLPDTGTQVRSWTFPAAILLIAAGVLLLLVVRRRDLLEAR